jgi:hypothetical protein
MSRHLLISLLLVTTGCAAQPMHLFDSPLLAQSHTLPHTYARQHTAPATGSTRHKQARDATPRPAPRIPQRAAVARDTSVSEAYRACKKAGRVHFKKTLKPGDIAFFHNTHDANGDGRNNDWYTAQATVESVSGAAATLVGQDGKRFTMTLSRPHDPAPHNTALRQRSSADLPYTLLLAAELWAGTCAAP